MGNLAIAKGWPSMMRGIRITSKNMNLISCREIGTYQVTLLIWMKMDTRFQGRIDDVIMTSGERVGGLK